MSREKATLLFDPEIRSDRGISLGSLSPSARGEIPVRRDIRDTYREFIRGESRMQPAMLISVRVSGPVSPVTRYSATPTCSSTSASISAT